MPPRRPPPLPQGLFAPQGPLAPGSAPLPPSPTTVHPSFVVDAHTFETAAQNKGVSVGVGLPEGASGPAEKGRVRVDLDKNLDTGAYDGTGTIHPLILDLSASASASAQQVDVPKLRLEGKGAVAVDIVVPCTLPLTEAQWDLVEEVVSKLDGGWGEGVQAGVKIVISGLLPPPLSKPSSPLLNDEIYGLHLARLAQLSLHSDVYLKALPPVVDLPRDIEPEKRWWKDRKELERVLRMYVSPAIEIFGTHRLIFGSFPALPSTHLPLHTHTQAQTKAGTFDHPIPNEEWYGALRKVVSELGEDSEALTDIMGQNAVNVYALA